MVIPTPTSLPSLHSQRHPKFAALCGTKAENWRSRALTTPVRQPSATGRDAGSGKISSSPFSNPLKMPCRGLGRGLRYLEASGHIGVDGAEENGMDRPPSPAKNALSDCVMLNAAAFEM